MRRALKGLIAAAVLFSGGAAQAGLEPHRAAYRLDLAEAHDMTGLVAVQGGLVIEWQQTCDGWLSNQRLGFVASTEDGLGFSHDVRFSSWESLDGSQLRYSVRSYGDRGIEEEYRGEASVEGGQGGTATFTTPEKTRVTLPPGTIFPTEHMRRILSDAAAGNTFVRHEVFDGWGFDALTQVTSVIGAPKGPAALSGEPGAEREQGEAWPVSMAYYNVKERADLPEFEAEFLLTASGVLRKLALDYGDFRLDAALENFEILPAPDC